MAERPVFIPETSGELLVRTAMVEFDWFPGMASVQRRRSVLSLHAAARGMKLCEAPLEVSSKSEEAVGVALSAFNLATVTPKHGRAFTVETAYQSSKVFEGGGPYRDLLFGTSADAKKDPRLSASGRLTHFEFFGELWALEPKTAFYDWIYLNALHRNPELVGHLSRFDAFTDIEFNPKRSINCQAYSVALYRSLSMRGLLAEAISERRYYERIIYGRVVSNANEDTLLQPRLL
jgi:hypothetical protein